MSQQGIVIISVFAIACGTATVMGFFAMIYLLVSRKKRTRDLDDEEGAQLQEAWRNLKRMEDRMTNLETILLNRERKKEKL